MQKHYLYKHQCFYLSIETQHENKRLFPYLENNLYFCNKRKHYNNKVYFMKNLLIVLTLVSALFSCNTKGDAGDSNNKKAQKLKNDSIQKSLKIALTPSLEALPLWVAREKKLFEKAKLNVTLYSFTADMDCDTAFVGTTADGMITDLIKIAYLKQKGIAITPLTYTDAYWQLIANKKARLHKVEQFSDKMIALTKHSALSYCTDKLFKKVALKSPFFQITVNDVFIRRDMLKNNEMDAVWLKEPFATAMRQQNHVVIADTRKENIRLGAIAFNSKKIKSRQKQQQLQVFSKVYNEACDSINKWGIRHYAQLLVKNIHCNTQTINALPRLRYSKITPIAIADEQEALRYIKQ